MEYLERASEKIGAKFIEYRPEQGAWVFEVTVCISASLLDILCSLSAKWTVFQPVHTIK